MRVCIRCNPVSELISAPDGDYCYLHGLDYVAEDRPDDFADPAPEEAKVGIENDKPAEGF